MLGILTPAETCNTVCNVPYLATVKRVNEIAITLQGFVIAFSLPVYKARPAATVSPYAVVGPESQPVEHRHMTRVEELKIELAAYQQRPRRKSIDTATSIELELINQARLVSCLMIYQQESSNKANYQEFSKLEEI